MIFDDFRNLNLYNIDKKVVDFLTSLDPEIPLGKHIISENAYVNIQEYETRDFIKLEAHKDYIDIQFVIKGEEKVYTTDTKGLKANIEYDKEKDVAFFETPDRNLNVSYLEKNKFILLYPDDAHSPCTMIENPKHVKKGIVKIKID